MCTFLITNSIQKANENIDKTFLEKGGPDHIGYKKYNNTFFFHYLLSVTGERTEQPIEKDGYMFMHLGEIYNYDKSLPSDIYEGINAYFKYGDDCIHHLDGEFTFIVYDIKNELIKFFIDPFGTRQIHFYKIENDFIFSTSRTKFVGGSVRLKPNSIYVFDLKTLSLAHEPEVHKWNLEQKNNSFDKLELAFEEAVLKRWQPNVTLWFSGGVDSSAVALCLNKHKRKFNSITINSNQEDMNSINSIVEYTKQYNEHSFVANDIHKGDGAQYSRHDDPYWKKINRVIRREQKFLSSRVTIRAAGSDEIENYPTKQNLYPGAKGWPEDLNEVFPWINFYDGRMRYLLDFHERVSLSFSQEIRSVYIDKFFVQEWLNTSKELKESESKAFQKNYIRSFGMPISKKNTGFAGAN